MNILNNNIYIVPDIMPMAAQVYLHGKDRNSQKKMYTMSDLSAAFIGCPGCGKTTQILKIVDQLEKNTEAVTVILDIKKEYVQKCFKPGDVVLSLYNIAGIPKENQVKWSLMKEAFLDTHPEAVLKEIASMMFKDAIEHSENKAFPKAAMLVFYGQLVHIFKSCNGKLPFTSELIRWIETVSDATIESNVRKYAELFAVSDLVSAKPNITSYGVRMELKTVLLDTFQIGSNFCDDNSKFSIRQFMHEGQGHKLFLVFDIENRKSSESIVRLLLDLALKESLSGDNVNDGDMKRYNFVLDEYAYLPCGLEYMDFAKDMGRSKGVRIFSGFQTFSQLKKLYNGKNEVAMNDLAGYGDVVVFKPHDAATREMVESRSGTEMAEITTIDLLCNVHTECREVPIVMPEVLNNLRCGEAVILPNEGHPFWFKFDK